MLFAILLQIVPPINYERPQPQGPAFSVVKVKQGGASKLAKKVGKLVAKGECDKARTTALEGGDFTLAERAVALCKQP